jgi:hypothetical protein
MRGGDGVQRATADIRCTGHSRERLFEHEIYLVDVRKHLGNIPVRQGLGPLHGAVLQAHGYLVRERVIQLCSGGSRRVNFLGRQRPARPDLGLECTQVISMTPVPVLVPTVELDEVAEVEQESLDQEVPVRVCRRGRRVPQSGIAMLQHVDLVPDRVQVRLFTGSFDWFADLQKYRSVHVLIVTPRKKAYVWPTCPCLVIFQ